MTTLRCARLLRVPSPPPLRRILLIRMNERVCKASSVELNAQVTTLKESLSNLEVAHRVANESQATLQDRFKTLSDNHEQIVVLKDEYKVGVRTFIFLSCKTSRKGT